MIGRLERRLVRVWSRLVSALAPGKPNETLGVWGRLVPNAGWQRLQSKRGPNDFSLKGSGTLLLQDISGVWSPNGECLTWRPVWVRLEASLLKKREAPVTPSLTPVLGRERRKKRRRGRGGERD